MTERDSTATAMISEEAAEWFVRLKDGDVEVATRSQYLQWLKKSPSHIAEVLRICRIYGLLRHTKLQSFVFGDETPSNVIELPGREPEMCDPAEPSAGPRVWRIAAGVAACALATLLAVAIQADWFSRYIETQASEWRHLQLTDGSMVRVGPHTKLRIRFEESGRFIDLPRGEAVFQVAKDPARPFIVNAGLAVVRAVGTEFGVTRLGEEVVVTVAEGEVAVARGARNDSLECAEDEAPSVPVLADQQVHVSRSKPVAVQQVSATRELAWARGRLIFETETVAEAIDEFNRRNSLQIAVNDSAIASRRVCCVFDAADPESFAEAVAAEPDIALLRDDSGVLRLVPETASSIDDDSSPSGSI